MTSLDHCKVFIAVETQDFTSDKPRTFKLSGNEQKKLRINQLHLHASLITGGVVQRCFQCFVNLLNFFSGPETKFIHPTDFDEKVGIQCEFHLEINKKIMIQNYFFKWKNRFL